jgi:hypothetical protein
MLTFSFHNQKINELASHLGLSRNQVVAFDLPAGYTCPMASLCRTYANRKTGMIIKGIGSKFRCYAASVEGRYPAVRRARWHNYEQLQGLSLRDSIALIDESLPTNIRVMRIHSSGDFFGETYFRAWYDVAYNHSNIMFFGYTKILDYVRFSLNMNLHNFKLVYSHGGKHDNFVAGEPVAYVVNHAEDARKIGVPVSCANYPADDYDYIVAGESFALKLHGNQFKGAYVYE